MNLYACSLLVLFVCSSSCKQIEKPENQYALRDSIIRKHLLEIDSTEGFDTTDINYLALKAYVFNDTDYLQRLSSEVERAGKERRSLSFNSNCLHLKRLQYLDVNEAYRFDYWMAFCSDNVNITVIRKADSASLHFILYKSDFSNNSCKVVKEYEKSLNLKEWEQISIAIQKADFWGLKNTNGLLGMDGDGIIVTGYKKGNTEFSRPAKFNKVERWLISRSTLADPFYLVLKLSGNQEGCIRVN